MDLAKPAREGVCDYCHEYFLVRWPYAAPFTQREPRIGVRLLIGRPQKVATMGEEEK